MKRPVRAIETAYGGRLYRSRVEARWAVFFDCLGIRFSYEPEGFVLRSGAAYLPDFYLPDLKFYLEIKGQDPTSEECSKCADLAEVLEIDALLAVGPPDQVFQLHWFDRSGQRDDLYVLAQDRFAGCGFWLVAPDHSNWIGPARTAQLPGGPMLTGAIEDASEAALSARFGQPWRRERYKPVARADDQMFANLFPPDPSRSAA